MMKYIILISLTLSFNTFAQVPDKCIPLEKLIKDIYNKKRFNFSSVNKLITIGQQTNCDDGENAQSMSDIVVQALAKDFVRTMKVAGKNNKSLDFVIAHVNSTTENNDLVKITENAMKICPKNKKDACVKVDEAARFALKETSSPKK